MTEAGMSVDELQYFLQYIQTLRKFDFSTPISFLNTENENKFPAAALDSIMRNSVILNSGLLRPRLRHNE